MVSCDAADVSGREGVRWTFCSWRALSVPSDFTLLMAAEHFFVVHHASLGPDTPDRQVAAPVVWEGTISGHQASLGELRSSPPPVGSSCREQTGQTRTDMSW